MARDDSQFDGLQLVGKHKEGRSSEATAFCAVGGPETPVRSENLRISCITREKPIRYPKPITRRKKLSSARLESLKSKTGCG
jgi:hypothetical protein